jgi:hypothetical protein
MAPDAGGGRSGILLAADRFVAGLAWCRRMPTHERESRLLVPLSHIADKPGLLIVTPLTLRTQLTAMNIRVACDARRACPRESETSVAPFALDSPVLAVQRKPGRRMVETRISPHPPGISGMT